MTRRVIVVCYAIEPGRGSEQGSGFNFVAQLAARSDLDVTVITRRNILPALTDRPELARIEFRGYDVPRRWTFWKRGGREILLYYYLWQFGVGRLVNQLCHGEAVDAVHQYNFHTDWAPHFLRPAGVRVVWGPICHQPRLPSYYTRPFGLVTRTKEWIKWLTKNFFWRLDPNLRRAVASTDVVLYANHHIAPPFERASAKVVQQTFGGAAFLEADNAETQDHAGLQALHVGRSTEIKGAHLAIMAFAEFLGKGGYGHLRVVGEGPRRRDYEALTQRLGLEDEVSFVDWMPQAELSALYTEADAFLYPSLGNQDTVVAEALTAGLPVVCVDGFGSHVVAGEAALTADGSTERSLVEGLARRLSELEHELADPAAVASRRTAASARARIISWQHTASSIVEHYG